MCVCVPFIDLEETIDSADSQGLQEELEVYCLKEIWGGEDIEEDRACVGSYSTVEWLNGLRLTSKFDLEVISTVCLVKLECYSLSLMKLVREVAADREGTGI